jgi:hypothetical protein
MYDWMKKNPGVRFDDVVTPSVRRGGYTFGGQNAILMHVDNIVNGGSGVYEDPRERRFLKEALTLLPDPRRKSGLGQTATKLLQDNISSMRGSRLEYARKDLKMLLDYEKEYPRLISGVSDGPAPAPGVKKVLVMCNNPTTDGPLTWPGHEMVAYVDVRDPVRTQEAHIAQLNEQIQELEANFTTDEQLEQLISEGTLDEEDREDAKAENESIQQQIDILKRLFNIPLPVEEIVKKYYVGINSLPRDLVVDVVLSAGCPIIPSGKANFNKPGVNADLLAAVQRHLRPGGELYLMGKWEEYHETFKVAYSPLVDFIRAETLTITGDYYSARKGVEGAGDPYAIFVRKAAKGGRRKSRNTRKARKTKRAPRKTK